MLAIVEDENKSVSFSRFLNISDEFFFRKKLYG